MSDLHSVRVPATMIVTALLVIILLSSNRTTYTVAPAADNYSLAACESRPVVLPPPTPKRVCSWPQQTRQSLMQHDREASEE